MQLKDYQNGVLEDLSRYLRTLTEKRQEAEEVVAFLKSKGREAKPEDYCRKTWDALTAEHRIPTFRDRQGNAVTPPYVARNDGLDRPIPNVCLNVPTGGGFFEGRPLGSSTGHRCHNFDWAYALDSPYIRKTR